MKKANILNRIGTYLTDVRGELKKVTWPTRNDLKKTTIAVIVISIIFGIYLRIIDYSFQLIIQEVIDFLTAK